MRIIAKSTLRKYWQNHATCRKELESWYRIASNANWQTPNDIKSVFPKASVVANNRIVFNIAGGNYRLVVKFSYKTGIATFVLLEHIKSMIK